MKQFPHLSLSVWDKLWNVIFSWNNDAYTTYHLDWTQRCTGCSTKHGHAFEYHFDIHLVHFGHSGQSILLLIKYFFGDWNSSTWTSSIAKSMGHHTPYSFGQAKCFVAMEGYPYFDGHGEISTDNTNGPRMILLEEHSVFYDPSWCLWCGGGGHLLSFTYYKRWQSELETIFHVKHFKLLYVWPVHCDRFVTGIFYILNL